MACTEFIKGTLNSKEFQNALRETTREDPAHLSEVEQALAGSHASDDSAKRDQLRKNLPATQRRS